MLAMQQAPPAQTSPRGPQSSKVFVGGLSWDSTGDRLRQYFENFGVVREAFVSYNRSNGRPRGFGFVVFESPEVADIVVARKHIIDRREVEAKRAVPKEETLQGQQGGTEGEGGHGSASSTNGDTAAYQHALQQQQQQQQRSRKVFVGGLAPSVNDVALREHFEAFGAVEDAVVMYDHDKRPRGFGFVTFVSEEVLEGVFAKGAMQSIHDKQIEVKAAVPRDLMPPSRGLSHGMFGMEPRFGGNRQHVGYGGGMHPHLHAVAHTAQFSHLPPRGPYGGGPRSYVPTTQPGHYNSGAMPGMGGMPAGLPGFGGAGAGAGQQMGPGQVRGLHGAQGQVQEGTGLPVGDLSVGKAPPGGYADLYAGSGMFTNSRAALAYNLASLQQAQAHLNAAQSVPFGKMGPTLAANGLSGGGAVLNIKALALAGGFGAAFPNGLGGGVEGGNGVGYSDASYQQGQQGSGSAADFAAHTAVTVASANGVGDFNYHDAGWSS